MSEKKRWSNASDDHLMGAQFALGLLVEHPDVGGDALGAVQDMVAETQAEVDRRNVSYEATPAKPAQERLYTVRRTFKLRAVDDREIDLEQICDLFCLPLLRLLRGVLLRRFGLVFDEDRKGGIGVTADHLCPRRARAALSEVES